MKNAVLPPGRVRKPYGETIAPGLVIGTILCLALGEWVGAAILGFGSAACVVGLVRARRG